MLEHESRGEGLCGRDGRDGWEQGRIDGSGVVEQGSDDGLDVRFAGGIEGFGVVGGGHLHMGAVYGFSVYGRRVRNRTRGREADE